MAVSKQALETAKQLQTRLEERERAKRDKLYLATEVLGYDFQPDVHEELFAQYVQFKPNTTYLLQCEQKDRLILWPRGHFKTTSVTVEIIQTILNNPDVRILIMQGTTKNTKEWLAEIKSHFMGEAPRSRLMQLFPEFCTGAKGAVARGNAESWTTPARVRKELRQATITVASPKSTKAGQHFDVGFFDDLVNDQNYLSPDVMDKVIKQFQLCIPLIEPGGYRYVTGTRYTFGDLYEKIIRQNADKPEGQKWVVSVKNCFTDDGKEVRFKQRTLKDGRVIGFTMQMLLEIQKDDPVMFACQYMNKPIHGATQLFSEELVLSTLLVNQDPKILGFHKALGIPETYPLPQDQVYQFLGPSIFIIDLASSKSAGRDHSVVICGKADNVGRAWVVDCRGDKWDPDQLAMNIIDMALRHRPTRILIEGTAAGKYAMWYIGMVARNKGVNLPLDLIPVNNQPDAKNFRIGAIVSAMKKKQIVFFNGLNRWDVIFKQFTEFDPRKDQHDDYPDTIGLLLQQFQQTNQPQQKPRHHIFAAMMQAEAVTSTLTGQSLPEGESLGSDFGC